MTCFVKESSCRSHSRSSDKHNKFWSTPSINKVVKREYNQKNTKNIMTNVLIKKDPAKTRLRSPIKSYVWKAYKKEFIEMNAFIEKRYKDYEQNLEDHPQYRPTWLQFWEVRFSELQEQGIDVKTHDFRDEWKKYFLTRLQYLKFLESCESRNILWNKHFPGKTEPEMQSHETTPTIKHKLTSPLRKVHYSDSRTASPHHRRLPTKERLKHSSPFKKIKQYICSLKRHMDHCKSPLRKPTKKINIISICCDMLSIDEISTMYRDEVSTLMVEALEYEKVNKDEFKISQEQCDFLKLTRTQLMQKLLSKNFKTENVAAIKLIRHHLAVLIYRCSLNKTTDQTSDKRSSSNSQEATKSSDHEKSLKASPNKPPKPKRQKLLSNETLEASSAYSSTTQSESHSLNKTLTKPNDVDNDNNIRIKIEPDETDTEKLILHTDEIPKINSADFKKNADNDYKLEAKMKIASIFSLKTDKLVALNQFSQLRAMLIQNFGLDDKQTSDNQDNRQNTPLPQTLVTTPLHNDIQRSDVLVLTPEYVLKFIEDTLKQQYNNDNISQLKNVIRNAIVLPQSTSPATHNNCGDSDSQKLEIDENKLKSEFSNDEMINDDDYNPVEDISDEELKVLLENYDSLPEQEQQVLMQILEKIEESGDMERFRKLNGYICKDIFEEIMEVSDQEESPSESFWQKMNLI